MDNKKIVIGESNCYTIGRNYNKHTFLSEMLKGREVIIMDDEVGEEYKSLQDEIIKPTN